MGTGILNRLGRTRKSSEYEKGQSGNYNANEDPLIQAMYNQLAGTQYGDLLNSNPYTNYDYTPSFWDKIGNAFNFNTQEDKIRMQMQQDSRNYASQIMSMRREEAYNSETAKTERMKAAGENPDLLGTSGVSEATEMTEPEARDYTAMMSQNQNQFQTFASTIMAMVNEGFAFAERFTNLEQMKQQIEFGRDNQARSIAELIAPALYREWDTSNGKSIEGVTDDEIAKVITENFPSFNLYRKGSKKRADMVKRVKSYTNTLNQGMNAARDYYQSYKGAVEGKKEGADIQSKYGFNLDDQTEVVIGILDIMNEGYKELQNSKIKSEKAEADYNTEFYENANGKIAAERQNSDNSEQIEYNKAFDSGLAAETQNATNESVKANKETDGILNGMTEEIFTFLRDKGNEGSKFATGCLTFLAMFRFLTMSNMMPSLNVGPKGVSLGL